MCRLPQGMKNPPPPEGWGQGRHSEGSWDRTGSRSSRFVLHVFHPISDSGLDALFSLNCPPVLQLAASIALPLQPDLHFFPKHLLVIPLSTGTGGSGILECACLREA